MLPLKPFFPETESFFVRITQFTVYGAKYLLLEGDARDGVAGEDGDVRAGGGHGEVRVGACPPLALPLRELEATEAASAAILRIVIPIVEALQMGLEVGVEFGAARLEEAPRQLVLVVGDLQGQGGQFN